MTTPSAAAYLLPGFDPAKAKVAELRGILLAHDIPYSSAAKKPELVTLFKTRIVPLIPRLLAEISSVRASDDGVLDGDSLDGSLRELDTDPEEFAQEDSVSRRDGKKKKSKRKSMIGRAQEAATAAEEREDRESQSPRKKGRKTTRSRSVSKEPLDAASQDFPTEYDEIVPLADEPPPSSIMSPKKRKASTQVHGEDEGTPRSSSILKARRRTIQSEGEAGFSDYNPFQSGGEDTPGRDSKKRKSSLGPDRLRAEHFDDFEESQPVTSKVATSTSRHSSGVSSPAKSSTSSSSRPELTTAASWSSTPEEARQRLLNPDGAYKSATTTSSSRRATMAPTTSAPTSSFLTKEDKGKVRARASVGGSSSSTPIGVKFMVPVEKVKTTPPEAQKLVREYEDLQRKRKLEKEAKERAEREREAIEPRRNEVQQVPEPDIDDEMDIDEAVEEPEEDMLAREENEREMDEFGHEEDPFLGAEQEEEEEESFAESEPVPPPVLATLRQDRIATPRRSEPLPYSPRQAQAQALADLHASSRRSLPLVTPSASITKRSATGSGRKSKLSSALSQGQQAVSLRPVASSPVKLNSNTAQSVKRVSAWTVLLVAIVYSLWWREEKLAVGFCDTNSASNQLVATRSTSLAVPALPPSLCTTLDALHLRPTCTPCPTHGFCEDGQFVGCSIDYVPHASALRLGGLLPIAPQCVPDTEKLMVVAMQASKASRLLRKRRGEVVCGGLERLRKKQIKSDAGVGGGLGDTEAFVYGLQADNVLSALMRENEASKSPFSEDVLEELNRLALNDLVNHGEVLTWQQGDDYWYASKTAEMPLSCQARLAALRSAKKHKTGLAGLVSTLMSILWLRYKLQARVEEKRRVADLVQTALVQLQRQERSHHADPVLVPFAHIAPSHLRDLVLQHVHSPTRRAQLWKKVEKVVEGNSNVRVMEVEQNGEELRGWQWVGATGARELEASPSRQTLSASASASPEKVERPEMLQSGNRVFKATF
ncbi:uncharacterized protein JCM15063_002194 [Sporobolomyces koalae]|uniref:uncharacterized protein n=1 Tax=Sporobolomyces koalae TaxID=500713 RepID=UPI00317CB67E